LTSLRQCLRHVDSAGPINAGGRIKIKATVAPIRYRYPMSNAETIRRIERFPFRRAPVAAEWRNKGYTLLHADTGRPIARLRPYGRDKLMEILYWSSRKERWAAVGPFGSTVVPLDEALRTIADEPIFWVGI
jgi:hypothetical protein